MIENKKIVIGTRASSLALNQARIVKNHILSIDSFYKENPEFIVIKKIITGAEKMPEASLANINAKGFFTKEIEEALYRCEIDIAVHSMKDVAAEFDYDFAVMATQDNEDPRDCFVACQNWQSIEDIPSGVRIGTSSSRRKSIISNLRSDLNLVDIRGNVETRIKKLHQGKVDGLILAVAGLKRLKLEKEISFYFREEDMIPAIGQGMIGMQYRIDDKYIESLIKKVTSRKNSLRAVCERSLMKSLNASCKTPLAGYAKIDDDVLNLVAWIGLNDGSKTYSSHLVGNADDASIIGMEMANRIRVEAKDILEILGIY